MTDSMDEIHLFHNLSFLLFLFESGSFRPLLVLRVTWLLIAVTYFIFIIYLETMKLSLISDKRSVWILIFYLSIKIHIYIKIGSLALLMWYVKHSQFYKLVISEDSKRWNKSISLLILPFSFHLKVVLSIHSLSCG